MKQPEAHRVCIPIVPQGHCIALASGIGCWRAGATDMHSADRAAIANRGPRHPRRPRSKRGMLTRPAIAEMHAYRTAVDATVADFVHEIPAQEFARAAPLIERRVFSRLRLARDV